MKRIRNRIRAIDPSFDAIETIYGIGYRIRSPQCSPRLSAGKTTEARADFTALSLSADATETARARAQAALALIDSGAAASLPAVLKAAHNLPEPALPASPLLAGPAADPAGAQ